MRAPPHRFDARDPARDSMQGLNRRQGSRDEGMFRFTTGACCG